MRAILLFRLSLSRLLFHSLRRSFVLSLAISLSLSLFHSLPRSFPLPRSFAFSLAHSLTHLLSRGDTSVYLAAENANEHYTKDDDVNNNDNVMTTFLKVNLPKLELCIAISPLLGHVEEK